MQKYDRSHYPIYRLLVLVLATIFTLGMIFPIVLAQSSADAADDPTVDHELRALLVHYGLTGDPSTGRDLPTIASPMAQLGRHLFFTKALSGEMDTACASCHLPTLGGGDDLALPVGVHAADPDLIGPGRIHFDNTPLVPRNAPTTLNIGLWDAFMFHDGRIESLDKITGQHGEGEMGIRTPDTAMGVADPNSGRTLSMAQARFPVTSEAEMRGEEFEAGEAGDVVRNHLAERLCAEGEDGLDAATSAWWQGEFTAIFGPAPTVKELITEQRIAQAIAAYEQSQIFVDTPWRAYVQGDEAAIGAAAKRGALIFYRPLEEGGANCVQCHSGDFFTDELFHVAAVPQIGPGKGDGPNGMDDYGRYRETHNLDDIYAFRTPTLLNITETGPYGHDGAYSTLEAMVRHMIDPQTAVATYDWNQLDPTIPIRDATINTRKALIHLQLQRLMGLPGLTPLTLSEPEVADLLAFLNTLTDPCVQTSDCLMPWMVDANSPDPYALHGFTQ